MIKQVTTESTLTCTQKWTCPNCGKEHEITWSPSPYRMLADNPIDEMCDGCEEFFTLSFYNEDWVKDQNEEMESLERIMKKLNEDERFTRR